MIRIAVLLELFLGMQQQQIVLQEKKFSMLLKDMVFTAAHTVNGPCHHSFPVFIGLTASVRSTDPISGIGTMTQPAVGVLINLILWEPTPERVPPVEKNHSS